MGPLGTQGSSQGFESHCSAECSLSWCSSWACSQDRSCGLQGDIAAWLAQSGTSPGPVGQKAAGAGIETSDLPAMIQLPPGSSQQPPACQSTRWRGSGSGHRHLTGSHPSPLTQLGWSHYPCLSAPHASQLCSRKQCLFILIWLTVGEPYPICVPNLVDLPRVCRMRHLGVCIVKIR